MMLDLVPIGGIPSVVAVIVLSVVFVQGVAILHVLQGPFVERGPGRGQHCLELLVLGGEPLVGSGEALVGRGEAADADVAWGGVHGETAERRLSRHGWVSELPNTLGVPLLSRWGRLLKAGFLVVLHVLTSSNTVAVSKNT